MGEIKHGRKMGIEINQAYEDVSDRDWMMNRVKKVNSDLLKGNG